MFRFSMVLAGSMTAVLVTGFSEARADYRSGGFGGSCGPSIGYSSQSYGGFGGYGGSYGGHGYGNYGRGWSGSSGRGSSHYDYQPTQIRIERGHIDVQPGHYDRHSSRHRGW